MKPRSLGVVFAADVRQGDVLHVTYLRPAEPGDSRHIMLQRVDRPLPLRGEVLCSSWVMVRQVKHPTDTSVALICHPIDGDRVLTSVSRMVEYPGEAPIVKGDVA